MSPKLKLCKPRKRRLLVVFLVALSLTAVPALPLSVTAQQAAAVTQTAAADQGWPRLFNLADGGSAVIYQPQVASWQDQKHLVAWSAVSYQAQGAKQPTLGTLKMESDTK